MYFYIIYSKNRDILSQRTLFEGPGFNVSIFEFLVKSRNILYMDNGTNLVLLKMQ